MSMMLEEDGTLKSGRFGMVDAYAGYRLMGYRYNKPYKTILDAALQRF